MCVYVFVCVCMCADTCTFEHVSQKGTLAYLLQCLEMLLFADCGGIMPGVSQISKQQPFFFFKCCSKISYIAYTYTEAVDFRLTFFILCIFFSKDTFVMFILTH